MLRNKRQLIIGLALMLTGPVLAQTNTDSPYSRFGIGMISPPGFERNRAMGGTGLALRDNQYINYLNPASYSAQDSMSFIFDFGMTAHYTYTESSSLNDTYYGANFDHLALSFPITKWWAASAGIRPYSKVGYAIRVEDFQEDVGFIDYIYSGNGGLNQLFLGTAVKLFDGLSIGANFNYLFGTINLNRSVDFPLQNYHAVTEVESRTIINDFLIELGLQYTQRIGEKNEITLGVMVNNKSRISAENQVTKRNTFPGSAEFVNDSTRVSPVFLLEESSTKGNIVIPFNLGIGLSYRLNDRLLIGFDYYQQDWTNTTFFNSSEPLTNSNHIHGGAEYVPDPEALRGYHNRIAYRLGGYFENSYLQLQDEQLKDYGISFGIGLPLRNTRSTFNLAFNAGRRGTLENNLIRENYMFLSFSVTLYDFWFMKRKYD
jgi:long-subunit fatty acid transport protein